MKRPSRTTIIGALKVITGGLNLVLAAYNVHATPSGEIVIVNPGVSKTIASLGVAYLILSFAQAQLTQDKNEGK